MFIKFKKSVKKLFAVTVFSAVLLFLQGCVATPPKQSANICDIFFEKRDWFDSAQDMEDKWGVPIHVPMAMMFQESSFKHNALPPKKYVFFGLVPWGRVSSAYGYSQAKTVTWGEYKQATGSMFASRENFHDAMDFMGWYITRTYNINKVSKWDANAQYLNYHEGWGGYKRKSYRKKKWLQNVAKVVNKRALKYATQLKQCRDELDTNWFMRLFN